MAHYHKRSNIESTFSAIKAKFGDAVRSRTDAAMRDEALCKISCFNITCVIQASHELGIETTFFGPDEAEPGPAKEIAPASDPDFAAFEWI